MSTSVLLNRFRLYTYKDNALPPLLCSADLATIDWPWLSAVADCDCVPSSRRSRATMDALRRAAGSPSTELPSRERELNGAGSPLRVASATGALLSKRRRAGPTVDAEWRRLRNPSMLRGSALQNSDCSVTEARASCQQQTFDALAGKVEWGGMQVVRRDCSAGKRSTARAPYFNPLNKTQAFTANTTVLSMTVAPCQTRLCAPAGSKRRLRFAGPGSGSAAPDWRLPHRDSRRPMETRGGGGPAPGVRVRE